ncbi:MAG: Ppx/GppA family phosphatase [Verrucomicrobiota bacterium]|jgi:exopolyphosphatase/guanosine-5'-triphosphate,3'-diphosphate pyrophosphatase
MNRTNPQRRAVIDIGTNSVKLLVADLADQSLAPVSESSKQTRLGAGFYGTRRLLEPAIALTADAVVEFSKTAAELGASNVRLIATSAARDALNVSALSDAIRRRCGLEMEILSGDKEADWVFRGVTTNPKLAQSPVLVLDVGGGSTEFIVGDHAVPQFRSSYGLGTVRLLEQLRPSDPPGLRALIGCRVWLRDFLRAEVVPLLKPALDACQRPVQLVGTGGTATILARIETRMTGFDRDKIEATALTLDRIRAHAESHWQMTLEERQNIVGMPPKRGDVILTGVAIYEAIMEQFGFKRLAVSTRGLRYWALLHP